MNEKDKKSLKTSSIINKKNITALLLIVASYILIYAALNLKIINGSTLLNRQYKSIVVLIFVNIILAVSLNLVTGFLGELSLGHAGFMMVGAYTSAIFTNYMASQFPSLPSFLVFIPGMILGGLFAGAVGFLVGIPVLRLRGDYLAIVTLALGEIIRSLCENFKITNGAAGLTVVNKYTNYKNFTYGFIIMVITIIFIANLIKSRQGRAIVSLRENYIASESVGISVSKFKVLAFSIGAFFAGIAGGIYAHDHGMILPSDAGYVKSIDILVIVVLGGMGSIKGSIIAAVVLTIVKEVLRDAADYRQLMYSIVLIAMVLINSSDRVKAYKDRILSKFTKRKTVEGGE